MTDAPESEVLEILLSNLVQSAEAKHPKTADVAVLQVRAPAVLDSPLPVRSVKYSEFVPILVA